YLSKMVTIENKGGLILHELVINLAQKAYNSATHRPSQTDAENLNQALLLEPQMTLEQLNLLLVNNGFEGLFAWSGGGALALGVPFTGPGPNVLELIHAAMKVGFSVKSIVAVEEDGKAYFDLFGLTIHGQPFYYVSTNPESFEV